MYNETAHKILDTAEELTQMHGYNGFSYKDLQNILGIKTSSIHYYFNSKNDLVNAMIKRYLVQFENALVRIKNEYDAPSDRLMELGRIYITGVSQNKFCLCGMLAAEMYCLPENIIADIRLFFRVAQQFVANEISRGVENGVFHSACQVEEEAWLFISSLEGAMLIARTSQSPELLESVLRYHVNKLKA